MSVNLVNHIYKILEEVIASRDRSMLIFPAFPDVKELPERLFVIEYTGAEPSSVHDGSIDLEMRWEIRFIKAIKENEGTRHDVQEMSWKIGAMFHKAIIPSPFDPPEAKGLPGFTCHFMGSQDDNFDYEQQSFESWVTELSIEARVGRSFFEDE